VADYKIVEKTTEFLENIIDAVREPLVVLDQDFRVIAVSRPFYEVFHVHPEETLGQVIYDIGNRQWDIPRLKELLETIILRSTAFNDYEVVHDFSTIGKRTMLLNARQIKGSLGKEQIVLLAIEDITDRRRMEEELQRKQRVESLGILAGGIAHDFNNLMAGLMANIEVAELHLKEGRIHEGIERLQKTPSIFARGQALTRRLLTFSKGGTPVRTLTALGPLMEDWVDFAFIGSDSTATLDIDPHLWSCDCDVNQIGQVVNNLLINARQATRQRGSVTVRASNLEKTGFFVVIEINNTGEGIPPDLLGKIFDPYFTTKPEGSGLGLAVAFSIVRQHQGWIDVTSHKGVGTAFAIHLPASLEEFHSLSVEHQDPKLIGTGIAVVMDDNDAIRDAVSELLGTMGFEVLRTKTGLEALTLYGEMERKGSTIAVFLLDNQIPGGIGGLATAQSLRKLGSKAKIIIMSGYFEVVSRTQVEDGFGRLAKPFTKTKLCQLLGRLPGVVE